MLLHLAKGNSLQLNLIQSETLPSIADGYAVRFAGKSSAV